MAFILWLPQASAVLTWCVLVTVAIVWVYSFPHPGKVLSRLGLTLPDDLLEGVVNSKPGCVEQVLASIRDKVGHCSSALYCCIK